MNGVREKCADCGIVTDVWVHGWDGKYRCMADARNGRWGVLAHHCPTCTCVTPPAAQLAPARVPSEEE